MRSIAVYPGSFDPLTNGHVDILKRSLQLFDKVIIAVAVNSNKTSLFSTEERVFMIKDVMSGSDRLEVDTFPGLLVDYCKQKSAKVIIRGLRAVTDFDYEYAISIMNKTMEPDLETFFLMASQDNLFVSSSIVKEVARHGRDVSGHVPKIVSDALLKKYKNIKEGK